MNILRHIVNGNLGAARIVANRTLQIGDTVWVNTNTAPTPSGEHIMKVTIKSKGENDFTCHESEPYFGYNRFSYNDIVG